MIRTTSQGADIALLEEKRLVELHHEHADNDFVVGDIYLGRVKKILPGLNAAFIDIGHEKDAFLHYLDMGPNIRSQQKFFFKKGARDPQQSSLQNFELEPEIQKSGKIADVLKPGHRVVVQIVKEPISTKGPRLSSQLSLAGRHIILMPFADSIAISKRIRSKEERERLRRLLQAIKPPGFGIILRTVAEGKMVAELDQDLRNLLEKWEQVVKSHAANKKKLLGELDKTESIVRDLLNDEFEKIVVDKDDYYQQLKLYIQKIAPKKEGIVKFYQGTQDIFQSYNIEKQIKSLFGKIVNLTGGAYVIIEGTEAMHVIDVNSGSRRSNQEKNQEDNSLKTNMEAGEEIARQLRLRDLGGIIVIDFIDMRTHDNRKKLYERMKEVMKDDRAKHSILPVSKFGLMQITRQRVRPEVKIETTEDCPMCKGTGQANPNILVVDEIESRLGHLAREFPQQKTVNVIVNPYIHSFLTNGIPSLRMKWMFKYKKWINIQVDDSFFITNYRLTAPHIDSEEAATPSYVADVVEDAGADDTTKE